MPTASRLLQIATLALVSCLPPAGALYAQEATPSSESPTPEGPKDISTADFANEASEVEDRLSQIQMKISAIDVVTEVTRELDAIDRESAEIRAEFEALASRRKMSSELNALLAQLRLQDTHIKMQMAKLSTYAGDLETLLTQTQDDIETWSYALRLARRGSASKAGRARTASILQGLRAGESELTRTLQEVVALQSRALDVRDAVQLGEQAVLVARRTQAASIYQRQDPPLWSRAPLAAPDGSSLDPAGYGLRFSWTSVRRFLVAEWGLIVLQGLLLLALGMLLRHTRSLLAARFDSRQQDGPIPWEDRAIEAVRHPWASALLLSLASMRLFYPHRVVDAIILTWVLLLPLWFVVFREMVPKAFHKVLIGLGVLSAVHIVATIVSGKPNIGRALLLAELLFASAGGAWLIRFLRTLEISKHVRKTLWFVVTSMWTKVATAMAMAGSIAVILGYRYFAEEAALLSIVASVGATAWVALERIVEAVATTSIYRGKLDEFRMVRANRDITAAMVTRVLRSLATILFLWTLADGTSAWRPIWAWLTRALSSDLGFGMATVGVTLGDVVAFFIILWLSWVLARFVSFVLSEEILPRLHMKTGVPYALTTFTRYVIIAVGFIAAISVLGIPLDRLTIVLSALGVGIGFGLQGLVNNVVSGFVLLTERPVRLRDKVEVEGVLGHVSSIGIRASTIRTFEGAEVIVPNGDLISQRVVNWTLSAPRQRVTIPVGVAYGTDPKDVLTLLRKVAAESDGVFRDPAPLALFRGFGDSSLDFELRIFMDPARVLEVPSAVTVAIEAALKAADIEIPFPQRDLHLRGVPEGLAPADADADADADAHDRT